MDVRLKAIKKASAYLKGILDESSLEPVVGIVLGSGLGKLADRIEDPVIIPYKDIPGFPVSTAIGHKGNFISGTLGGRQVLAMQGRIHYYEGYPMDIVTLPVRVMLDAGIKTLVVSNAAGGINYDFHIGDIMIITDHINLLPNPLIGPNMDELGPRFPDMTRPYDPALIALAEKKAAQLGFEVRKGVYIGDTGPSYETPAEYKFYRTIGADAVGMSTVPEVIVARHADVPVFGMSVITNEAHDDYDQEYVNDGQAVIEAADRAAKKMAALLVSMINEL
jgi:purine-nucleoside phosphorylase